MNGRRNKTQTENSLLVILSPGEKNQCSGLGWIICTCPCMCRVHVFMFTCDQCVGTYTSMSSSSACTGIVISMWGVKLCMRTIPLSHLIIVMSHGELSRVCQTPPLVFPSPTGQTMLVCSIQTWSAAHFNPLLTHEIASDEAEQLNNAHLSQKET